ncbi:MAG: hypothetical protein K8R59_06980 [Thermoanaerobaculales bacterium]|nr:hypothetical protein [Thermoanaerobaculales bacterium]
MEKELVVLVEEAPEGGFTAKALGTALFTDGETLEEVEANVRDAIQCHFEEADRPRVIRLHFVRDHVIAV